LGNLAYVLHYIEHGRWLDSRDSLAMAISAINTALFSMVAGHWWRHGREPRACS